MKIIAQQTDSLNTYEFWDNVINKDYIYGMSINIALTQDNQILTYTVNGNNNATTNTIENSTLDKLNNYEIQLFDDALKNLSQRNMKKNIYVNIAPFKIGTLTEENIKEVTARMNLYVDMIKEIIDKYPDLNISLHCINRSILTILKQKIKDHKLGLVVYNTDLNFIDVDYYVITMNAFDDAIIDLLLREKKEIILYINSDYYIAYVYDHYIGEKSTPHLQQTFNKLKIMNNYPEIINKVFNKD